MFSSIISSSSSKKMSLMNVYAAVCMHACRSRLRMDGRRMEREGERARYPKREEKEEEEEEEDQEEEMTTNNSIYTYISTHTPFHSHQHQHQPTSLFPKNNLHKSNIPPPPQKPKLPQKCNSSPSSPPLPSQPLPLRSSRPGVERKSAPVEHHIVANWTFWASLLFLARMVRT